MKKSLAAIIIASLPFALMATVKVPAIPVPAGAVEIYNAGNAEFAGFRIVVTRSGAAWSIDGAGRGRTTISPTVTSSLFADVTAAQPLSKLPAQACSNAATDPATAQISANTAVAVIFDGDRSPILQCSSDPRSSSLLGDVQTVQHALYVQAYRIRQGLVIFGGSGGGGAASGSPQTPPVYPSNPTPGYPNMYPGWVQ